MADTQSARLRFETIDAQALTDEQRQGIVRLCTEAYDEDFSRMFEMLPGSVHVLAYLGNELVGHACWVTRWLQPGEREPLRTAYVEAVAVAPAYQGRGWGKQVMRETAAAISQYPEFDLAALSPSEPVFYAPLGWESWRGPTAIRTEHGLIDTTGDDVMILRLPATPPLDLDEPLSAEWRVGELW